MVNRVDVQTKVNVYEVGGEEMSGLHRPILLVKSHWNRDEFVVLSYNGKAITVMAADLEKAIANATNA